MIDKLTIVDHDWKLVRYTRRPEQVGTQGIWVSHGCTLHNGQVRVLKAALGFYKLVIQGQGVTYA